MGGGARLKGFNELLASERRLKAPSRTPAAPNVRITSSRIMPAESVDVIALLLEAAQDSPVNCAEIPAPAIQQHNTSDPTDDSGEIRVGREETLDEDEDEDHTPRKAPAKTNRWGSLGAKLRGHFEKLIDRPTIPISTRMNNRISQTR